MLEAAPSFEVFDKTYEDILAIDRQMSRLPVQYSPLYYKQQRKKTEEIKEKLRKDYVEGGLVSKDYPVPFVKLDPKDRESDDLGGMSYAEQMKKLGF